MTYYAGLDVSLKEVSIWLQRGMAQLGLPAICIDARKAHKSLSARLNKSDKADAEGLAQLARMNWYTPVHIRSEESDRLRALVGGRERLIRCCASSRTGLSPLILRSARRPPTLIAL
jgi:transposase